MHPDLDEPGSEPTDGLYLRDLVHIVLQKRRLIGALVAGTLALATVASFLQTPRYRGTALIQIAQGTVNLTRDSSRDASIDYEEFYTTQQGILTSRTLGRRVIQKLDLTSHPVFALEDAGELDENAALAKQVDELYEMVQISPRRGTQLVEIRCTTPDAELSARIANTLAHEYIAYTSEAMSGVARNTSVFIQEKIEELRAEIEANEKKLQEYSQREDVVMLDERENIVVQQLEALNRELAAIQAERVEAEASYRSLSQEEFSSFPEILDDNNLQNLRRQQAELQRDLAELESKYKPSYPEVQRAKDALAQIQARLAEETETVGNQVVASARVRYETALERETLLRRALERQRQETRDLSLSTAEYQRTNMELESQREMLSNLLRERGESGLSAEIAERESLMTARLVDEAVVPTERYSPRVALNIAIGLIVGVLLGAAVAFVHYHWDTSIRSVEDLRRRVRLPVLGEIPHADGDSQRFRPSKAEGPSDIEIPSGLEDVGSRSGKKRRARASKRSPDAVLSERFKFARSSLMVSNGDQPPKTVLVTSSMTNEGKSFVSSRLAASIAALGKQVLLVDADLRRPSQQDIFGLENDAGMTNLLTDEAAPIGELVRSTSIPNLSVLLSGPQCDAPAELLVSAATDGFLERAMEEFDTIVIDSSPLLPVVDTLGLVGRCDAVVLVVRSGHTTHQSIATSQSLIEKGRGRITGVILNDVDFGDYAHRYYYGTHGYEYGAG